MRIDARFFGLLFGFAALAAAPAAAQPAVAPLDADDPLAAREWAQDFFFSDRGVVLDEDLSPEDIDSAPLKAIQVGYRSVHGDNAILLLWRERAGDPQTPISIVIDGVPAGAVPPLPPAERPGTNYALLSGVPSSTALTPDYLIEALYSAQSVGFARQSALESYPMGTEFTPTCAQSAGPGGACLLTICWINPGPPTSGFEVTVGGEFQTYLEEPFPGTLNEETVAIAAPGAYSVRVTSIIVGGDPDPSRAADDPEGRFYEFSGSFRGPPREISCNVTCGDAPPPPPRNVLARQTAYAAGAANAALVSWEPGAGACAGTVRIDVDGARRGSAPLEAQAFEVDGLSLGEHVIEASMVCDGGGESSKAAARVRLLAESPHQDPIAGALSCGRDAEGGVAIEWSNAAPSKWIDIHAGGPELRYRGTVAGWQVTSLQVGGVAPGGGVWLRFVLDLDGFLYGSPLQGCSFRPRYIPGVCDGGGESPSVSSAVAALRYLFQRGDAPPCLAACDANGDLQLDVSDVVRVLVYLFAGGGPPVGWQDPDAGRPTPICVSAGAEADCERAHASCE
jgi:hypothetical protein